MPTFANTNAPVDTLSPTYTFHDSDNSYPTSSNFGVDNTLGLPVEIWDNIIEYASYIPGATTLDNYAEIDGFCKEQYGITVSNQYKDTMSTKLSLSLTSKLLNAVTQRFLFRHLRINRPDHAIQILEATKRFSGPECEEGLSGPARWTLRIDLAMDNFYGWDDRHTETIYHLFLTCQSCSTVSTMFSMMFPDQFNLPTLLCFLSNHPSLKRLEVNIPSSRFDTVEELLGDKLEVLWVRGKNDCPGRSFKFPGLRMLVASDVDAYPSAIKSYNLRACVISEDAIIATSTRVHYGLYVRDASLVTYLSPWQCMHTMDCLTHFSKLRTLSFSYSSLSSAKMAWPIGFLHQHLECIQINGFEARFPDGCRWNGSTAHLQDNFDQLVSTERFPQLKTIQFFLPFHHKTVDKAYVADEARSIWLLWLYVCKAMNIRLLVAQGIKEAVEGYSEAMEPEEVYDLLFMPMEKIALELKGSWTAKSIWKQTNESPF